jgi:hypothetical protein
VSQSESVQMPFSVPASSRIGLGRDEAVYDAALNDWGYLQHNEWTSLIANLRDSAVGFDGSADDDDGSVGESSQSRRSNRKS